MDIKEREGGNVTREMVIMALDLYQGEKPDKDSVLAVFHELPLRKRVAIMLPERMYWGKTDKARVRRLALVIDNRALTTGWYSEDRGPTHQTIYTYWFEEAGRVDKLRQVGVIDITSPADPVLKGNEKPYGGRICCLSGYAKKILE
jgi:hypothetical protein